MAAAPDLKPVYLLTGSDRPKIETRARAPAPPLRARGGRARLGPGGVRRGRGGAVQRRQPLRRRDGSSWSRASTGGGTPRAASSSGWKAADVKAIEEYLASPAPGTVLALVGEELKKDAPLTKACAKTGDVLAFEVAKRNVANWVAERFSRRGARAEPDACAALVHLVGDDLHAARERDRQARALGRRTSRSASARSSCSSPPWPRRRRSRSPTPGRSATSARTLAASETIFEREGRPRRDTAPRLAGALGNHLVRVRRCQRLAAEGVRPRDAAATLKRHPFYVEKVFAQAGELLRGRAPRRGRPARRARPRAQGRQQAGARSRARSARWSTSRPEAGKGGARNAGDEAGGAGLLARGRVLVQRAARGAPCRSCARARDARRRARPRRRRRRGLEPLRQRLDRRAVAQVLEPLALGDPDALFLLLMFGISKKGPHSAGAQDRSRRALLDPAVPADPVPILAAWTTRAQRHRRLAWSTAIFSAATGPLARARAPPRDRRRELLRRARHDQRLHGRLPDPEPRPRARRRRRALLRLRARLQRAAREGREGARLARRVDRLLALPARSSAAITALFILAAPLLIAAARPGALRRPRRHALADPLPDRRPARPLRDRRRDPEQLRPVHDPGADAGLLEPGDHRRPRPRRAARRHRERQALRLRRLDRRRHGDPVAAAAALAARARRPAPARARLCATRR